jgi:hypothetical protein
MADVVGEDQATAMVVGTDRLGGVAASYLVQEEDGVSRFILEEGDGFILLEANAGLGAGVVGEDHAVAEVVG